MKVLKWLLLAAGALILVFAVVLAIIVATFDPNQYKAQVAQLVKEKTQRTLTLEGDIRLMLFPKLGVHLGKASLSEFKSETQFASLEDMRVALAVLPLLTRQVVVDQVQLEGLRAKLVKHRDGTTNFADLLRGGQGEAAEKDAPAAPAESGTMPIKFEVDGIRISNAALSWEDEASGASYAVSNFNLKSGRLAANVPAKFDLGATIRGSATKLEAKLQAKGTLSAAPQTQQFALADLAISLNAQAAGLPPVVAAISGSASADMKQQTAAADLAIKLDDSNIQAKVAIADLSTLRATFDVAIDQLDVDRYAPPAKPGASADPSPPPDQSEAAIDFSALKQLDLAGTVHVGELTASNIKVQNLRLALTAKKGLLQVDPLTANLYQGSVQGVASVDANRNRVAIKQTLTGVSVGPLLRDAIAQDILEGRGNVVMDLESTGTRVSGFKKTLNGTARLELKDGAIKGIDLAKALRDARALFSAGKRDVEQTAAATEKTDFSEMSASFDIKNGIAHNGDLLAKSPFLRLTGEGDVNLPASSLDYLAKASIVASSVGQGGRGPDDLRAVTLPVRVSGPFTALKYKLEFGSLLSDSAKQKMQEQKEVIKDKLEQKLRSKLLGKPDAPSAPPAEGEQPAPGEPKLEDQLKQKLKKLF